MDKSTIIGVILGIIAVGLGMALKGVSPLVIINPAAILIILVGTAASVAIAMPSKQLKNLPALFKIIFKEQQLKQPEEYIKIFVEFASIARKEGILALEAKINEVDDPFLKNGLNLVVDGQSQEFIRDVMLEEIEAMEDRHRKNATIFSQAGMYAPTLGVLGAVIGLIAALGNMSDTDALGQAIAAAFVATMMGIFTGYVFWHPFATKLKLKSQEEVLLKQLIVEGVISIENGEAPISIQQKLAAFLPVEDRKALLAKGGENSAE